MNQSSASAFSASASSASASSASAFSASASASQKPQENAQYPPSMNQSSAHLPHSTCWRHVKSPGGGASQQRSSAPSEPQACPEVSACESAASAFRAASSPALAASFSALAASAWNMAASAWILAALRSLAASS